MVENDMNEATDDLQYTDTGEDNIEDSELEELEESSKTKISKLQAKLKACEAEKTSHLEDLQRAKADFLNTKKRLEEQRITDQERNLSTFLESLLPLCDSFDMAFANSEAWEALDESWRKGVEGIRSQLDSVLKKHNVTEISAQGEHFDPERHEAMSTVDGENESETVVEVLQKGYERNGTVIRPAKVVIQN